MRSMQAFTQSFDVMTRPGLGATKIDSVSGTSIGGSTRRGLTTTSGLS